MVPYLPTIFYSSLRPRGHIQNSFNTYVTQIRFLKSIFKNWIRKSNTNIHTNKINSSIELTALDTRCLYRICIILWRWSIILSPIPNHTQPHTALRSLTINTVDWECVPYVFSLKFYFVCQHWLPSFESIQLRWTSYAFFIADCYKIDASIITDNTVKIKVLKYHIENINFISFVGTWK